MGNELDWSGSEYGQVAGCCECSNELTLSARRISSVSEDLLKDSAPRK